MNAQIFQIFYRDDQLPLLEKEFIPYDNRPNPRPEWFEYYVFRSGFQKGWCDRHPTGFISWKYHQKTGLKGKAFVELVDNNPNFDVYFINPFVDEAALYLNIWLQGEKNHPGLIELSQKIFNRVGYNIDLKNLVMPVEKSLFCNYFVAQSHVWRMFIDFCEPIYHEIEAKLDEETKAFLSKPADKQIKADYRPFIFERLFSTFLCVHPDIKFKNYQYDHATLATRYRGLAPYIEILTKLKNEISMNSESRLNSQAKADFLKVAGEALKHADYGPNESAVKKTLRKYLIPLLTKSPKLKRLAFAFREVFAK